MDAVGLLDRAQEAGLRLEPVGDKLLVRGPKRAEAVVKLIAKHKEEVLAALSPPIVDARRWWRERLTAKTFQWFVGDRNEGDCVTFEGSLFQAQRDTGKSPLFAKHWLCLATAGVDGRPIRHRGEFAADVEYREHDAVLVGGSSFVALRDSPGTCPGSGWQLIAAAGGDGAIGPRGERGERGLRGERAPTITGWRLDCAAYTAVPLLSDGSEGAPLELRVLFEQFYNEVTPSTASR